MDDVYAVIAVVIVERVLQALGIAWLAVGMVNHDLAVQGVGILCVIIAALMLFFIERETGGKTMTKRKTKVKAKGLSNTEKKQAAVKGTLVPAEMGERMASKLGKIWGW